MAGEIKKRMANAPAGKVGGMALPIGKSAAPAKSSGCC